MPGILPSATSGALNRTTLPLMAQADPDELVGWWAIAQAPTSEPYPCRCGFDGHWRWPVTAYCDCVGRTDLSNVTDLCCARRAASGAAVEPRKARR